MDMQHHGEIMDGRKYLYEENMKVEIDRTWKKANKISTTKEFTYIYVCIYYVLESVALHNAWTKVRQAIICRPVRGCFVVCGLAELLTQFTNWL